MHGGGPDDWGSEIVEGIEKVDHDQAKEVDGRIPLGMVRIEAS